ncbi:hypothetical protein ACIA5D_00090 [Actinoplanes sp. NPDC051513]|uniref:AbiTii domain-containing protein n=1 Tax=Actinoplanes sp. NPDC051513 TaxID=3363908 RepID=UPI00378F8515
MGSTRADGYPPDTELPAYRVIGAALLGEVHRGPSHGQAQRIDLRLVPEDVLELIIEMDGRHEVRDSVAEITTIVARAHQHSRGLVVYDVPDEARLRAAIAENAGRLVYSRIFWSIAAAAFEGLLDRIRTTAVSIVTEVRMEAGEARSATDGETLSAVADQAVALHVSGSNNEIHVNQAGLGDAGAGGGDEVARSSLRWTRRQTWWTIAGFFVAIVGIVMAHLLA